MDDTKRTQSGENIGVCINLAYYNFNYYTNVMFLKRKNIKLPQFGENVVSAKIPLRDCPLESRHNIFRDEKYQCFGENVVSAYV